MSRRRIGILLLLAVLSVAGIVATQVYWLDKAFEVRRSQMDLRKEQARAEAKQFNDRVVIALTNVADEILTINNDPAKLFEAVKQVRPNYFTVAINDTVHPFLLESLLTREFQKRNILENFEYGVYDCFTDSIVYGDYVALGDTEFAGRPEGKAPQIKWDKDGHYFGVFFPHRENAALELENSRISAWAFSALISLIVFVFFAYSVYIILKQKRLSEMKTDFINNMTHELKTPISTISLSGEVLMGDKIAQQPERLKQYAELIYKENNRLRLQVEKVLQLAALDRGKVKLNKSLIDLHAVVEDAAEALRMVFGSEGPKVTLRLDALDHEILADPVHIDNIIHNLLDNAVKYGGEKPEIEILTRNDGDAVVLIVKDNGIGIPKKSLPYVFDKFYRVPTGNVHDVKGFGLGLYYVRQTVRAHGGKISVQSSEGEGTAFTVKLPLNSQK